MTENTDFSLRGRATFAAKVYRNAALNQGTSAAFRLLAFDATTFNTGVVFTATGGFQVTKPGIYRMRAVAEFAGNATGNRREIQIAYNETYTGNVPDVAAGSVIISNHTSVNVNNSVHGFACEAIYEMSANDTATVQVFQNSGGALAYSTTAPETWFDILYLGPNANTH